LIEVNLLPGGKKRTAKGRGFSFSGLSLPRLGGGGGGGGGRLSLPGDPYVLGAVAAGVVSFGVMAWLFLALGSDREEVQVRLDAAVQDSSRFADLIARTNQLTARRDSIAQRVAIIQDIDAGRYVWPHILDEVARALPDYTWIREIVQVQEEPLQVRLSGRAGSPFAITNFMQGIEASPFLRAVQLERTEQTQSEEDQNDIVYVFELTATFEPPPIDQLQTVPLFEDGAPAAPPADSTGG